MTDSQLIVQALEARQRAYAPYSGYQVGAALLTADGILFHGCNIESASYTPTICAERTAFAKAVSEGHRSFTAIAVVGGMQDAPLDTLSYFYPCGVCRQVMLEFCNPDTFRILVAKSPTDYESYLLRDLLPHAFGPQHLQQPAGKGDA